MDLKYAINFLRETRTDFETQAELAAAADIDEANLSRFMSGKQNLSRPRIDRLARALNSAVWEIYLLAELKEERRRVALFNLLASMDNDQIDAIFRLTGPQTKKLPPSNKSA